MPAPDKVLAVVKSAHAMKIPVGYAEYSWNGKVHNPLLKLAAQTSKHRESLTVRSVCVLSCNTMWCLYALTLV